MESNCAVQQQPQQQQEGFLDSKEEFGDIGGMFGDGIKSSSTSPLEDALLADPDSCGMCGEVLVVPRVLSCLHVFCEQCLDRKLMGEGGDAGSVDTSITCPTCNQETKVGAQKLAALPLDITIPPPQPPPTLTSTTTTTSPSTTPSPPPPTAPLLCSSCTAREPAVARCRTCHHLLCANCDKAHRFMRLFETHRVHTLDEHELVAESREGGDDGGGRKGRIGGCEVHTSVDAVWYCAGCAVVCCGPCGGQDEGGKHAGHQLEDVLDCETRVRHELDQLLGDARAQSQRLQAVSSSAGTETGGSASSTGTTFEELAHQRTAARDLITETCHSYKAVLERCRDRALDELQGMYRERELKLMDMTEKVGKDISSLDDACRFTAKLLDNGTVADILQLRRLVAARLQHLLRNTDRMEQRYTVEFRTDLKQFEHIARKAFGHLATERDEEGAGGGSVKDGGIVENGLHGKMALTPLTIHPPPSNTNNNMLLSNGTNVGPSSLATTNSSPISLPTTATSMQSSFDGGDMQQQLQTPASAAHLHQQMQQQMGMMGGGVPPGASPIVGSGGGGGSGTVGMNGGSGGGNMQGFSSIAEYNLAQLATLAENSVGGVVASAATSPNPAAAGNAAPFIADMFHNDTVFKNLQSLAKLGLGNSHEHASHTAITNGHSVTAHHNPNNMLVRTNSPSSATITINTQLLNGFGGGGQGGGGGVSAATSPLLSSGTPDDIGTDPLGGVNGAVGGGGGGGAQPISRVNKVSPMQIRCKFGQLGASKGQFNSPHGFCLGLEEDIVVADTNNHRIQIFEKTGTFKFQFGAAGKDEGQLWYPRKVAVMRSCGKYVVCDRGNERSRMQIFTKNGHFLKKIAIRYIDIVAGLAVTAHGEIVAVDSVSPTVFVISENGDLLRWFDCSDYMREPSDIAIHGKEFYVCDFKGHNVVVFSEDGIYKRRIGWETITSYPNGIDISDAGDVLIGDSHGNRFHVAVFSREGPLISEFECPYVKVSRCCGLKITSEGYVVTLAKNNHHVLVLNTLYIL